MRDLEADLPDATRGALTGDLESSSVWGASRAREKRWIVNYTTPDPASGEFQTTIEYPSRPSHAEARFKVAMVAGGTLFPEDIRIISVRRGRA